MTTRRRTAKSPPPSADPSPDGDDAFAADPFAALGDDFAALDQGGEPIPGLVDHPAEASPDDPFAVFDESPAAVAEPAAGDDHERYPGLETSNDDPFAQFADEPAAALAAASADTHDDLHGEAHAEDEALPSLDELAAVQMDHEDGGGGDDEHADGGVLATLPSFDDSPEDMAGNGATADDLDAEHFGGGLDLDAPDDDLSYGGGGGLPALADAEGMLDTVDEAQRYPRFLFDTSFDVLPAHLRVELEPVDPEPETPPAQLFDAAELEAARNVARAEGEAAGYDAAVRSAEAQTSRLMETVLGQLPSLLVDRDAAVASLTKEAARLAHAMVAKMLPELTQRHGLVEVEAVVQNSLEKAVDSPRILFRLHPANVELMRARVEEMAALAGFGGRLMVTADGSLGEADVRVDWGDGGAERLAARAWSEISAIVTRAIEALDKAVIPAGAVIGWGQGTEDAEGSELERMTP